MSGRLERTTLGRLWSELRDWLRTSDEPPRHDVLRRLKDHGIGVGRRREERDETQRGAPRAP